MPTAIRTLELDDPPADLVGLTEYARALVLVRWRGEPVGQMMVHVTRGRVSAGELRERALAAAQSRLRERWVHDFLGWNEAASVPPTATVAVCTRDRTDDLRRCLDALRTLPDDGQEVLVVDNCPSSDATRDLVARYPGVRYVREERAGLDIARNRALHEARGDVVAFTDDDAAADPGWLRALLRNFGDPRTLCVTGLTMPLELETEAQEWFERTSSFGRGFWRATYDGTVHSTLAVARIGAGVNMALRRSAVEAIGPFDEALDAGTPTQSGGDHEMFTRILASGYKIIYEPAALVWHRHRRDWHSLRKALYGYGVGVYAELTRALVVGGELNAPRVALGWLRHTQLPALVRALLRRPESVPLDLVLAELRGCAAGPRAYFTSRRLLRATTRSA
ncbi:MAG: glycosyltransferase [Gemmatimonadaceae bacterium]